MLIESVESSYLSEEKRSRTGRQHRHQQLPTRKLPHSHNPGKADFEAVLDDVSFLRLPEVKAITGLSKTTIYELIRVKDFPAPVRLGPRVVAWVKSEVRQWAVGRVQASRSAA